MIFSMTAFARHESQGDWGSTIWELRSVNHRYLEINLRLPDALGTLEPIIRERIKARLQRGKIDINLRYQPSVREATSLVINKVLVNQLLAAGTELAAESAFISTSCNLIDILKWPGVLQVSELDTVTLTTVLTAEFEQALTQLITIRQREGLALRALFEQRLQAMETEIAKVKKQLPTILIEQREKLWARFAEAKVTVEATRLEQEMVLFAQKIDVMEELERLQVHITEIRRVLQQGGAIGRRLDFLSQELNREANTLGAKAVNSDTTLAAVELKVLIEQLREQVQNIE